MKNTIEIRLEIIRSVRATKFEVLDYNIRLLEDSGQDASDLRAKRQRYRDITLPYKTLLEQEVIEMDNENPILAQGWDAFTSVDWN